MTVLVVGESQPRDDREPLQGETGLRLFRHAGRPDLARAARRGELPADEVVAVNLFDLPDLGEGPEEAWYDVLHAGGLGAVVSTQIVLVLGVRAARRLEVADHSYYLTLRDRSPLGPLHVRVGYCPHPSGRNRWWNEPAHRRRGRAFLRGVFRAREV